MTRGKHALATENVRSARMQDRIEELQTERTMMQKELIPARRKAAQLDAALEELGRIKKQLAENTSDQVETLTNYLAEVRSEYRSRLSVVGSLIKKMEEQGGKLTVEEHVQLADLLGPEVMKNVGLRVSRSHRRAISINPKKSLAIARAIDPEGVLNG